MAGAKGKQHGMMQARPLWAFYSTPSTSTHALTHITFVHEGSSLTVTPGLQTLHVKAAPACVTIEHASSVAPVMPIAGVHCCCCCCMPAALLGLGPAPRDPASLARPAPAALLVLLLVLSIVLRASCSPEPTVAAGELSTGMSLQMLLVVVEGSADSSTSLPALRPALCLPGPLGGRVASAGAAVSDSPPHDRQRRAFCKQARRMQLVDKQLQRCCASSRTRHLMLAC